MGKLASNILILLLVMAFLLSGCQREQYSNPVPAEQTKPVDSPRQVRVMDYGADNNNPTQKDSLYIKFDGKPLILSSPLYFHAGRYYIPLKDTLASIGGGNGKTIVMDRAKRTLKPGSADYISLFDFAKMLDLIVDWDIKKKTVSLFTGDNRVKPVARPSKGKPALVRLEDIAATEEANSFELAYFKAIADYFHSNAIPFSVAWVPRYVDPGRNIDNDLAGNYSMYNTAFVFMLDYLIDSGGVIGLHGYTHQYGKKASIDGVEFGPGVNDNEAASRKRFEMAISAAKALDMPVGFFEFPHYSATKQQYLVAEEYFDCIYQHPYNRWVNKAVSHKNKGRSVKYISTPLDYLNSKKNVGAFLDRINSLGDSSIASFFFHPHLDYEFINVSRDSTGRPSYNYSKGSLLHQIVDAISKKGYRFVKPSEL